MFPACYRSRAILTAALAIALSPSAWCLNPSKTLTQYAHRIWGQEEGLFQPTIYSILQTRDGFLWLGTQDTLIRFDGVSFREFEFHEKAVLHGSLIRTLLQDREGNLWVGTLNNGLAKISASGEFRFFGSAAGMEGKSITHLSEDRNGAMWVSTEEGLGRIIEGEHAGDEHARMFTQNEGLPSNQVRASCEAANGMRWIAGRDFPLGTWDGSHFLVMKDKNLLGKNVTALECSGNGSVWAGTDEGAVQIHNGHTRLFTTHDGLPDNAVSFLIEGPAHGIWIGTNDGVTRYDGERFSAYRVRDGLSHSLVLCLAFDREGSLWAGTKNGLDQLADSAVTPFTTNEGLSSNETSALVDDHEGQLWIGTLGHGLNVFNGHDFKIITLHDGLSNDHVLSLAVDNSGDVWAGTADGVTRLRSGKVIGTYLHTGTEVRAIYVDTEGDIWAGTNLGVNRWNGSKFVAVSLPSGPGNGVVALSGATTVRLFVSNETSQLNFLEGGAFNTYELPAGTRPVVCYLIDHQHHTVWMGTLGSSLLRWQNGKIARVRVRDGLYDNRIYSILKDDRGNLWMASSKGIFRIGEQELNDFADGKRSSVLSIPFSTGQLRFECRSGVQPAACKTRDGRLWFSTTTGLVVIDPNHLESSDVPPPVRITALIVDGQRVELNTGIRIQPGEKNLEIRYAGLSFVSPEKVTFQYILDGFSRTWTDAGSRREAFFTNLPPGQFHFKVRARSAAGLWTRQAASLELIVEPRLYQRWWFFPALFLLLAAVVAAGYRTRVQRLKGQFALITAERTRIARELHDTLLQGLSGVTMQLHALWLGMAAGSREKRLLGAIIQDAGQYSAEARQSLWGLRSSDSDAQLFSDRLAELARSVVSTTPVSLVLDIQPLSIDDRPEAEFQLLRIAKEALSNALKHADASQLRVSLSLQGKELHMTIEDDGKGFASEAEYHKIGHFGLMGMKERAAEIGAVLDVESSARGTLISIQLSLGRNAALPRTRQLL